MVGKAAIKAGLIGAAIMVILNLLGLIPIPFLGCVCLCIVWLAYAGVGALAAHFMEGAVTTGDAAKAGALAGVISGAVSGIVSSIITAVRGTVGGFGDVMSQMDPEMLRQMQDYGIDPGLFTGMASTGGIIGVALCCCLGGLVISAALGAIGGIIYASVAKKE